ncbi:aromatic amino acid transport family protein [Escherichia coli]
MVFGSLLALVIYLFWLYCMGNIPRESFKAIISSGGNVDSLVKSSSAPNSMGLSVLPAGVLQLSCCQFVLWCRAGIVRLSGGSV